MTSTTTALHTPNHSSNIGHAMNGHAIGGGGASPKRPPLPHIDDLTSVPTGVDPNLPIGRILDIGDLCLRQAESARDFRRPDIAWKEYIRAFTIVAQVIPQHKEYVSVKNDRGALRQRYYALKSKVEAQQSSFEAIKAHIKDDNQRSGVLPLASQKNAVTSADGQTAPFPNGIHQRNPSRQDPAAAPNSKKKPVIQPKPQSLHGNAVPSVNAKPANGGPARPVSLASVEDLNARFANLRAPRTAPSVQDPRIKTRPIVPPRPQGPRAMPTNHRQRASVDIILATDLPKQPDAIYSPARGTVSSAAGKLPSSTPHGLFTRTGSMTAFSNTSTNTTPLATPQLNGDYFTPAHSVSPQPNMLTAALKSPQAPSTSLSRTVHIPPGDAVTPQELVGLVKTAKTLIIDVRPRSHYDEGHIMSQFTICIEPEILLRDNISSEDIAESMILAPATESQQFERRDTFELVVFYDQNSESIPANPAPNTSGKALSTLSRALVHLNYKHELRHEPKLLKGGLDAWKDLLGPNSLGTSNTSGTARSSTKSYGPHLGSGSNGYTRGSRQTSYPVPLFKPEEVSRWQEAARNDDLNAADSPSFVRSKEDFLRRYPAISIGQESMISPTEVKKAAPPGTYVDYPPPPTKPAPALPRPSYTGLSHHDDEEHEFPQPDQNIGTWSNVTHKKTARSAPSTDAPRHIFTGLSNPRSWCYANSAVQALRSCPGFSEELIAPKKQSNWNVPRKPGENSDPPQLMFTILGNLIQWMSTGKFQYMNASTLMRYSNHACRKAGSYVHFGGDDQQDTSEFILFLFQQLDDETNIRRDQVGTVSGSLPQGVSTLQGAIGYWTQHCQVSWSLIDKYWRGIEVSFVNCTVCNTTTRTASQTMILDLPFKENATLSEMIEDYCKPETFHGFDCDKCKQKTTANRRLRFARLPEFFCIALKRFTQGGQKLKSATEWDFNSLKLDGAFVDPNDQAHSPKSTDVGFIGPFTYECYGVISHSGNTIQSGHYYAYVRNNSTNDPYAWYKCNDTNTAEVQIGSRTSNDLQKEVFGIRDRVPYVLIFRRKKH